MESCNDHDLNGEGFTMISSFRSISLGNNDKEPQEQDRKGSMKPLSVQERGRSSKYINLCSSQENVVFLTS